MAIGLLRDNHISPDGFTPLLAKSWVKSGDSWVFTLRTDLKWSDGSPILPTEVYGHFKKLLNSKSRHLRILYTSKEITLNDNILVFKFGSQAPEGFLDELALADATLTLASPPSENHWAVTSGPYIIESFNKGQLVLKKNQYFQLEENYPESVTLSTPGSLEKINTTKQYDLFSRGNMPFSLEWDSVKSRFFNYFPGSYNSVHYFSFESPRWTKGMRATFRSKITEVYAKLKLPEGFQLDNQIVPQGMPERGPEIQVKQDSKIDFPLKIKVYAPVLGMEGLLDSFNQVFESGVELTADSCSDCNLEFHLFKANQKESLGNWSFLLSDSLQQYSDILNPLMEKASSAVSREARIKELTKLNELVQSQHLLAPVMWDRSWYYHSNRISLKKWNPFDLSMRLYQIEVP